MFDEELYFNQRIIFIRLSIQYYIICYVHLLVAWTIKNCSPLLEPLWIMTLFTQARYWTLHCVSLIHSMCSNTLPFGSILILGPIIRYITISPNLILLFCFLIKLLYEITFSRSCDSALLMSTLMRRPPDNF
jgi:hypothetical protein